MNKKITIWLIAAASLVLIGSVIFGGVMTMLKWNFGKLSTVEYETNTYAVEDDFRNISVDSDVSDIEFLPSEDGKAKIVCYEADDAKHKVTVVDGTLMIKSQNAKKWYGHIGINWGTPKITVYLPEREYAFLSVNQSTGDVKIPGDFKFERADISTTTGDVELSASVSGDLTVQVTTGAINVYVAEFGSAKLKASTGDVSVSDVTTGDLDVSVSTGKVNVTRLSCERKLYVKVSTGKAQLSNVKCGSLESDGSTGDITLIKVIADEKFSIERTTGDVKFDGCDAADISVKTSTGSVTGSLLTEKLFSASSNTGKVSVPSPAGDQKCVIRTDTGKITITVQK